MNENQENRIAPKKLYSTGMIRWGTIFFGPLAGSVLVAWNFKNAGDKDAARKSVFIGILTMIILLSYIYFVPDIQHDIMPFFYIPLLYNIILSFFWMWYQGDLVEMHRIKGGAFYSSWKALGFSLLSMLIASIFTGGMFILKPPFPGEKMEFGKAKNAIYFSSDVNKKLVEQSGAALEDIGLFGSDGHIRLRIGKKYDTYWITLLIMEKALENSEIVDGLNMIRTELQRRVFRETTRLEIFELKFPRNFRQEITGSPSDAIIQSFQDNLRRGAFFSKLIGMSSDPLFILDAAFNTDFHVDPDAGVSSGKGVHLGVIITRDEKTAQEALDFIAKEGSFEQAAKKFSIAPTAVNGGDIGYVEPEHLDSKVSAALARLNGAGISGIVACDSQFVILKVYK